MQTWLQKNAGWIFAALAFAGSVCGVYGKAAFADTDKRLSGVERELSDHKTAQVKRDKLILEKLDALCRATPNANCPLGFE